MVNHLKDYYNNLDGLRTRAIKIYPKTYTGTPICMKVELYGCLAGSYNVLLNDTDDILTIGFVAMDYS